MLTLAKSEVTPLMQERMSRMLQDTLMLSTLKPAEARAIYTELETVRDALSVILDKADGKHV
jgi:hypothetical protein